MDGNYKNCGDTILPQWFLDAEIQAVIIAGLCCVGAWVILQWTVQKFFNVFQLMFSVLWPLFVVIGVMVVMPSWRKTISEVYIPRHVRALKDWTARIAAGFNGSCTS